MIGNWELYDIPFPQRFTSYAWAYLRSATHMCEDMVVNPKQYGFPDANVTLLLAAHSIELFLKGAILRRNASYNIITHSLEKLKQEYDRLYPDQVFRWQIPFRTEYAGILEHEEIAFAKTVPTEKEPPSIRYRYPMDKAKDHSTVQGFSPNMFLSELRQVNADYLRIERAIENAKAK